MAFDQRADMQGRGMQRDTIFEYFDPVDHLIAGGGDNLVQVLASVFKRTTVGQKGRPQFVLVINITIGGQYRLRHRPTY